MDLNQHIRLAAGDLVVAIAAKNAEIDALKEQLAAEQAKLKAPEPPAENGRPD